MAEIPGLTATLAGSGLSDSVINGTVPLHTWLGNVTMWIGERKVPVAQLAPTSVSIIVPWDIQPDGGSIRIQAEVPGDHTPFYFPGDRNVPLERSRSRGRTNPPSGLDADVFGTHQHGRDHPRVRDWLRPGIPRSPRRRRGAVGRTAVAHHAPAHLFQRRGPLRRTRAGCRRAGLSDRLRIGPTPGYQKFTCTLAGSRPFVFLTLNIVQ